MKWTFCGYLRNVGKDRRHNNNRYIRSHFTAFLFPDMCMAETKSNRNDETCTELVGMGSVTTRLSLFL
jgi:hypothetical protein